MCIRDSLRCYDQVIREKGEETARAVRHVYSDSERVKEASCLLYTSDAADERSSVDLGGRRIIKKKTKHAT